MDQTMEINNKIKVTDFLNTLIKIEKVSQYALTESLNLFGGRNIVIQLLFNFFTAEPDKLKEPYDEYIEIYKSILFDCSNNKFYNEDWDEVWYIVKDLPLRFVVDCLECYPPGKRNIPAADRALSFLLNNKYYSSLNNEIYNELKDLFTYEPSSFLEFSKRDLYD